MCGAEAELQWEIYRAGRLFSRGYGSAGHAMHRATMAAGGDLSWYAGRDEAGHRYFIGGHRLVVVLDRELSTSILPRKRHCFLERLRRLEDALGTETVLTRWYVMQCAKRELTLARKVE